MSQLLVKSISATKRKTNHGGPRKGSGRKAAYFSQKCSELALSPKFFAFAKQVFNREKIEARLSKDGSVVYIEPSTGDTIYLWEKLAAYGFGKPTDFDASQLIEPMQKVINDTQLLKEIYALNGIQAGSHSGKLDAGTAGVQAGKASA